MAGRNKKPWFLASGMTKDGVRAYFGVYRNGTVLIKASLPGGQSTLIEHLCHPSVVHQDDVIQEIQTAFKARDVRIFEGPTKMRARGLAVLLMVLRSSAALALAPTV